MAAPSPPSSGQQGPVAPTYLPGEVTTTNLVGAGADDLSPSSSDAVVSQLNRAEMWLHGWNIVAWILLALSVLLAVAGAFVLLVVAGLLSFGIARAGFSRLRVSLEYEIDPTLRSWYKTLGNDWSEMTSTNGRWRLEANTQLHTLHHQKVNAGAKSLVARHPLEIRLKPPRALRVGINTPTITSKQHSLVFLPDRILIKTHRRWSDIRYEDIEIAVSQSNFIEDGEHTVPPDGQRVGETWKYVNVRGGPDRRFNDNRLLPVMRYSEVLLTSATGFNWELQLSRHDVAYWLQYILEARPAAPVSAELDHHPAPRTSRQMAGNPSTLAELVVRPLSVVPANSEDESVPQIRVDEQQSPVVVVRPPSPMGVPRQPWGVPSKVIEVAGETHHEADISELFDGEQAFRTADGAELRDRAVLVPDPDNPFGDGHAVAVFVLGRHVGYIPHNLSSDYFLPVSALTSQGVAVTVDARLWAAKDDRATGFRARATLTVPQASELLPPPSMPGGTNVVLLPAGNPLQVTGEEEHLAFLIPYIGQTVAVTLHTATTTKAGKQSTRVEVQLERNVVGRFTTATSTKIGPLVEQVERRGGLSVARAVVRGNSLKADVTVYVARAGDVDQDWLDTMGSAQNPR